MTATTVPTWKWSAAYRGCLSSVQTARFWADSDGTVMEQRGRNGWQRFRSPEARKWLGLAGNRCHWLPPVAVWIDASMFVKGPSATRAGVGRSGARPAAANASSTPLPHHPRQAEPLIREALPILIKTYANNQRDLSTLIDQELDQLKTALQAIEQARPKNTR